MTERERYRTLGNYYIGVVHNYDKAIENFEALTQRYPADSAGLANLALSYFYAGQMPKAMAVGQKTVEIYPRNVLQRTNYAFYAMYAGDFGTAIDQANKVLQLNPSYEFAFMQIALSSLAEGDTKVTRDTYIRLEAVGPFGLSLARIGEADLGMYMGRNQDVVPLLTAGIEADQKDGSSQSQAQKYVALAEVRLALGDRSAAADAALKAAALSKHESVLFPAARVLIEVGQSDKARKIAETLDGLLQTQTSAYARLIMGDASRQSGRFAEALEALKDGAKRHDSWFAHFLLGETYVQAGHFAEALPELDACLKRRGEATDALVGDTATVRYLPPVYYWTGRAQEGLGIKAAARAAYEEFLRIRAAADPRDPLTADARKRLGPL